MWVDQLHDFFLGKIQGIFVGQIPLRMSGRQTGQRAARSARRLYSDFVVDGTLNALFATEISFGCLNENVTE